MYHLRKWLVTVGAWSPSERLFIIHRWAGWILIYELDTLDYNTCVLGDGFYKYTRSLLSLDIEASNLPQTAPHTVKNIQKTELFRYLGLSKLESI
jgi:hypothetical protein